MKRVGMILAFMLAPDTATAQCKINWNGLGDGVLTQPNYASVTAITIFNGDVFIGGGFTVAGGSQANRIARWDGNDWFSVGGGITAGVASNYSVQALCVFDDDGSGPQQPKLYVGGAWFTSAGGVPANNIARWNGATWSALTSGIGPPGSSVTALAVSASPNYLYVGGQFSTAGGLNANNIARWNGTSWATLGSAISPWGRVYALLEAIRKP